VTLGTLDDSLRRSAAAEPAATAVRGGGRELSYAELERAASSLAAGLRACGVRRGDRVAIMLPNGIDAAIAIYATLRAGAVLVPVNPSIKAEAATAILADCGAETLVCQAAHAEAPRQARAVLPELRLVAADADDVPDVDAFALAELLEHKPLDGAGAWATETDLAAVIYTSGSTGSPKGVMLTHRNVAFAARSITEYLELRSTDRVLSVLPLSFDYGLYQLFLCVRAGASLLLEPGVRYPGSLVTTMIEQRVTGLPGVPTLFQMLLALPGLGDRDWPHLRFLTSTGAPLSAKTIEALRRTFPHARLYSMYGLTECKRVSYLPPDELDRRQRSVGIPIPGTEAWVENDAHCPCRPGEIGQLMVSGPHVMQGYWGDPDGTAARLRPGRWPWQRTLATGDLFSCDEDGFLYFVGRMDDVIKSRGEKVALATIEDVLRSAPGVLEAAAVGVDDEILGQAVHAHVVPEPGRTLEPEALRGFCADRLERHLVPTRIVLHRDLPKTPHGKIDKQALVAAPAP
jgi:amino acid adenylation domain-containing protein